MQGSCLDRLCIRARESPMTDIKSRLHAWSTRFHLGLVLSQITCLTAGSYEPRASQGDYLGRPQSSCSECPTYRKCRPCNATGELSKRGKGNCISHASPGGEATRTARQTLLSKNGSSPRAKQDMQHGRRKRAGDRQVPLKCAAKMSQL